MKQKVKEMEYLPTEDKQKVASELLRLLEEYYHYKYMTYGLFGWMFKSHKINMFDFMEWLNSKLK